MLGANATGMRRRRGQGPTDRDRCTQQSQYQEKTGNCATHVRLSVAPHVLKKLEHRPGGVAIRRKESRGNPNGAVVKDAVVRSLGARVPQDDTDLAGFEDGSPNVDILWRSSCSWKFGCVSIDGFGRLFDFGLIVSSSFLALRGSRPTPEFADPAKAEQPAERASI